MARMCATIAVFLFLIGFVSAKNENQVPSTMCPRYCIEEYYSSLFKPLFNERIHFVTELLKLATDGSEQLLTTLEKKKGGDGTLIKQGNSINSFTI